jgi:hypothetical protein
MRVITQHLRVYLAVALRANIALRTIDWLSACRNSGAITLSHIRTVWLLFCYTIAYTIGYGKIGRFQQCHQGCD